MAAMLIDEVVEFLTVSVTAMPEPIRSGSKPEFLPVAINQLLASFKIYRSPPGEGFCAFKLQYLTKNFPFDVRGCSLSCLDRRCPAIEEFEGDVAANPRLFVRRKAPQDSGVLALRQWVGVSSWTAVAMIAAVLAGSWGLSYLVGGAAHVVPHWYYAPIMFTAARFGLLPAVVVAVISGVLSGPLLDLDVATGTPQETVEWLSRFGFFVGGAVSMSLLVRPFMPSVWQALRDAREEQQVHGALERGELFLRFQPILQLGARRLYGFEALIRWQHPTLGELGPDRILPAAERSDGIFDLGMFVVREACQAQVGWAKAAEQRGEPPPHVTVNMSARELGSPVLMRRFGEILADTAVDPKQVCVEITESVLVDDFDLAVARLEGLRSFGVQIAVDDFGTGYSSLAAVHRFPIDIIKLDRQFVAGLGKYENSLNLIAGLVFMARFLNLTVIAEGIESEAEAEALSALDVDLGQGFLFDRPLTAEQANRLVAVAEIVEIEAVPPLPVELQRRL